MYFRQPKGSNMKMLCHLKFSFYSLSMVFMNITRIRLALKVRKNRFTSATIMLKHDTDFKIQKENQTLIF